METIRNMGLPLKMNPFQQKQNPLIPNLPQILQLPRKPGSCRTTTDMAIDIGSKRVITKSWFFLSFGYSVKGRYENICL